MAMGADRPAVGVGLDPDGVGLDPVGRRIGRAARVQPAAVARFFAT
jgi:hypothetical protein